MEIALLVFLFLVGSIAAAVQALKRLERRGHRSDDRPGGRPNAGPPDASD